MKTPSIGVHGARGRWGSLVLALASVVIIAGAWTGQGVVAIPPAGASPTGSPGQTASLGVAGAGPVAGPRPPALPVGAFALFGPTAGTTPLHLTVTIASRNPAALTAFAAAVSTPGSPEYHQFLNPAKFASRFGPTPTAIQELRDHFPSLGLTPGAVSPGGLSFRVNTSFAQAASALHTSFQHVLLPSGRVAYRYTSTPRYPAGVQAILGLDNMVAVRPLGVLSAVAVRSAGLATSIAAASATPAASGPTACSAAISAASAYSAYLPSQLASAYSMSSMYSSGALGGGVNVALYELAPYNAADIAAYQSCYGTSASITNTNVDGGTACTSCGAIEDTLDIEGLIGLAPKAAVTVYEAPNSGSGPYDNYAAIVNADTSQVISSSWGACEAAFAGTGLLAAENTLFQQAAAQGQSVVAAAGDSGSEACTPASSALAVDDPASQPYVTGVGGTDLTAVGPPPTETVWNTGSAGGGGGGISTAWAMPAWQSGPGVVSSLSSGAPCAASSGYCREVPDVTASADPNHGYVVYYSGTATGTTGWQAMGGASAAAPLWAAIVALTDSGCASTGNKVGFLNPALYMAGSASVRPFNDITTGNNDILGTNGGLYPATTGYDMASGLGSPIASSLFPDLCPAGNSPAAGVLATTVTTAMTSPTSSVSGGTVTYSATVTSATGTPSGSVAFSAGATALCSANLTSGSGSCTNSNGPVGIDTVSAYYSGDSTHSSSTGTTLLTVTTTTTLPTTTTTTLPTTTTTTLPTTTTTLLTPTTSSGTNPTASAGGTTATATGTGSLTVTPYGSSDPVSVASPNSAGAYMDVRAGSGSNFSSITITDCNLGANSILFWWNGSTWLAVAPQSYEPATGCITTTIVASSSPSVTQMSGTLFGVGGLGVNRLAGATRDSTAVAVSRAAFPVAGTASAVVLARNDVFADALAGGPLAAAEHGPLLLTSPTTLDPVTQAEMSRVLPHGGTVYVLGGTGAIAPSVVAAVQNLGYKVLRVAGSTRFATAVAIAQTMGSPTTIFEATGLNFPDALSAVPATVAAKGAILLTNGSNQAPATASYLRANPDAIRYAVGGPAAQADPGARSIVGANRFATSALVAQQFFPSPQVVAMASGLDFPDALSGGPYTGSLGGPVLLVPSSGSLPIEVQSYLSTHRASLTQSFLFGGTAAVGSTVQAEILTILG